MFRKCDVEQEGDNPCAKDAEIEAMPTFKFYKNGKELPEDMLEGANEEKLRELLKKHNEWQCLD